MTPVVSVVLSRPVDVDTLAAMIAAARVQWAGLTARITGDRLELCADDSTAPMPVTAAPAVVSPASPAGEPPAPPSPTPRGRGGRRSTVSDEQIVAAARRGLCVAEISDTLWGSRPDATRGRRIRQVCEAAGVEIVKGALGRKPKPKEPSEPKVYGSDFPGVADISEVSAAAMGRSNVHRLGPIRPPRTDPDAARARAAEAAYGDTL